MIANSNKNITILGNGKGLNFTNGNGNIYGISVYRDATAFNNINQCNFNTNAANKAVGTSVSNSNPTTGVVYGIVTSGDSGLIGILNTSESICIIKY